MQGQQEIVVPGSAVAAAGLYVFHVQLTRSGELSAWWTQRAWNGPTHHDRRMDRHHEALPQESLCRNSSSLFLQYALSAIRDRV